MIANILDAVFSDVGVDVVKTGMLTTRSTVKTIVEKLQKLHTNKPLVVDPVMVSTSGAQLIPDDAIFDYIDKLIPMATVVTPNLTEAQFIASKLGMTVPEIKSLDDVKSLAKIIGSYLGPQAVLLKGGHLGLSDDLTPVPDDQATKIVDVLYYGTEFYEFQSEYVRSTSTHGTGCTLASAIAANLANGHQLVDAVKHAIRFVQKAIATARPLGKGHGPVNHMHNLSLRPFVRGHFLDYLLSHPKVKPYWQEYVNHPFTKKLGNGQLSPEVFRYFLEQDYVYLTHYARAHSLAGYKSHSIDLTAKQAQIVLQIQHEMRLHIDYCSSFGISLDDLKNVSESMQCYAYSRYILDVGLQEDGLALEFALSPCLLGYVEAAQIVADDPQSVPGNPYWRWVDNYRSEDMLATVKLEKGEKKKNS